MSLTPQEIVSVADHLYLSGLFGMVSSCLVVYDWSLLFNDELETIYQSRWSIAKVLYLYIRFITPPGVIFNTFQLASPLRFDLSDKFCSIWANVNVFFMFSCLMASNVLLTLRLTALYARRPFVVWCLRVFFLLSYGATLAFLGVSMYTYGDTMYYDKHVRTCGSLGHSAMMPAIFYAPAAYEFTIFALTAWRAWQDNKLSSNVLHLRASSTPFLTMLYRDGAVSFLVMVIVRGWNIWIYVTQPLSSYNMGTCLMWATSTVLTTRVYLNLVFLIKQPTYGGSSGIPPVHQSDPSHLIATIHAPTYPHGPSPTRSSFAFSQTKVAFSPVSPTRNSFLPRVGGSHHHSDGGEVIPLSFHPLEGQKGTSDWDGRLTPRLKGITPALRFTRPSSSSLPAKGP